MRGILHEPGARRRVRDSAEERDVEAWRGASEGASGARSRRGASLRALGLAALGLASALALGCAGGGEPVEPAPKTAEDLYNEATETLSGSSVLYLIETVDYPLAIAKFQEIIDNYPFSEFATLSELKIADAYFAQRDFVQASSFYQEFIELHPKHPKVPYALLRNGECAYGQMLAPDQDQGKTRDALKQFETLIERFPQSEEAGQAREFQSEARDRLAIHEVEIGNFYFDSEKYHAAVPRYRDALVQSEDHTGHRATRAKLGIALVKVGDKQEGERILNEVLPDPELEDEVREIAEERLGMRVEVRAPEPVAEEGGGWSFWPFGGGDEEPAPAAAPADTASIRSDAAELPGSGSLEGAAPEGTASDQPAPEEESGSWFWPF